MEIYYEMSTDYEIFSMVILSLPLIQEGQLSVSGKRMCTSAGVDKQRMSTSDCMAVHTELDLLCIWHKGFFPMLPIM